LPELRGKFVPLLTGIPSLRQLPFFLGHVFVDLVEQLFFDQLVVRLATPSDHFIQMRVRRYSSRPRQLCFDWCRARFTPWFAQRFCIMSQSAPSWLPWEARQDVWLGLDRWGWMTYPNTVLNADQQCHALEFARRHYAPALDPFHITPIADRALRELLALCRQQGIAAMLLLMPEGTEFQSWYAPTARAEIDTYLARLNREYDVPLVDARSWLPKTAFFDSHHLHPNGATAFTQRFARELLKPSPSPQPATGR
jgi:hypothetical protein